MTKQQLNELTYAINAACIEVHRHLGPGLLESAYQKCLQHEFQQRGIQFDAEFSVPLLYKETRVVVDFRCDFLVEDIVVLELKAVEHILPVHAAQLMTYMRLLEKPKGLLINFNVVNLMKEGHRPFVNDYFRLLPDC